MKGYQRGENDYVMLEDEALENVALDSTKRWLHLHAARQHRMNLARHLILFVPERSSRPGGFLGHPGCDGIAGAL